MHVNALTKAKAKLQQDQVDLRTKGDAIKTFQSVIYTNDLHELLSDKMRYISASIVIPE